MVFLKKREDKVRIVHVITGLDLGGAEVLVTEFANRMKSLYDVSVISLTTLGRATERLDSSIPVLALGLRSFSDLPMVAWKYTRFIQTHKPNILHAHLIHADLLSRFVPHFHRLRQVTTVHVRPNDSWALRLADQLTRKRVSRFVCVSPTVFNDLTRNRIGARFLSLIPNGVDLSLFQKRSERWEVRQRLNVSRETTILLAIANLRKQKGLEYLLQALPMLHHRPVKLFICGEGPYRENLEKYVSMLSLKNTVSFLGERKDVSSILHACDCFILPSLYEGLPLSLVEALAAGCRVVTTNIPENRFVLEKVGFPIYDVQPKDSQKLAWAIDQALDRPIPSVDLAYFSIDRVIQEYQNLYEELLK